MNRNFRELGTNIRPGARQVATEQWQLRVVHAALVNQIQPKGEEEDSFCIPIPPFIPVNPRKS